MKHTKITKLIDYWSGKIKMEIDGIEKLTDSILERVKQIYDFNKHSCKKSDFYLYPKSFDDV
jgi:hypothetical protein